MSRIASVTPQTATVAPGGSVDITVEVDDVPADGTATVEFTASDGTTGEVAITIDRSDLEVVIGAGPTPAPNQVRATVDVGSLSVVGADGDTAVLRYTAP